MGWKPSGVSTLVPTLASRTSSGPPGVVSIKSPDTHLPFVLVLPVLPVFVFPGLLKLPGAFPMPVEGGRTIGRLMGRKMVGFFTGVVGVEYVLLGGAGATLYIPRLVAGVRAMVCSPKFPEDEVGRRTDFSYVSLDPDFE
eukprot:NODE_1269_length_1209_cov_68.134483_g845_i1.p2 GENE.NODE_1269_length_1209_cov_68.134483_g845_i1~~NODE_1269_length_1209_cov_68.134483_g845_i1.p2  ORF type:complete len:140 (-),score=8.79 NODE_1269_length_1209_cov_68.134483_g845_i1:347-766(-)